MSSNFDVLIVGGGTAGLSVAARLAAQDNAPTIGLVEPSSKHYYQPLWTLVGGGVFDKSVTERDEEDYVPAGVTWIQSAVTSFDPDNNKVITRDGATLEYGVLVVCPGIQLDWYKVKGLEDALGSNGVCSNYSFKTVDYTWKAMQATTSGRAIFTFPNTPIKCAGAPQKIMWLAEHHFERSGIRDDIDVTFACATAGIFGIPRYAKALSKIAKQRNISENYKHNLVEVRGKEAIFHDAANDTEVVMDFEMLHVTPPQSAPDFVKQSPLANEAGWVDVDKFSTQHVRYPNVFSLGDASSLPCSKTGAAIRKQAPVTAQNIIDYRSGLPLSQSYDGYASCPLVTGYGRLMLAEFGYDGKIMETFPFDQNEERYSMWVLKTQLLPRLYWNGMLRGRA